MCPCEAGGIQGCESQRDISPGEIINNGVETPSGASKYFGVDSYFLKDDSYIELQKTDTIYCDNNGYSINDDDDCDDDGGDDDMNKTSNKNK